MVQASIHDSTEASTRDRLIQAAAEVFVEHGYRHATVRDICTRAGANIAAVNYHFRDKEGLYHAVLEWSARQSLSKFQSRAAELAVGTPEERLALFIRTMVERMMPEGAHATIGKLMAREMADPTPALDQLIPRFIRPQYEVLMSIVLDLLGQGPARPGQGAASLDHLEQGPDQERLRLCCNSILGQVLFYKHARPVIARLLPQQRYDAAGLEQVIDHVTRFSLSAVRALADRQGGQP